MVVNYECAKSESYLLAASLAHCFFALFDFCLISLVGHLLFYKELYYF